MHTEPSHKFLQRLHQTARTEGLLLRVMFELTYRCNFNCGHCYIPKSYRHKGELKTREVYSILEQLKDIGCFYLGFTGGEPFVRKDIFDILGYAKKMGFEVIIYSNGSLINIAMARLLQHLRPNKIDITIPAVSQKIFERITRMPSSHRKVFDAIDLLHQRKIALGLKTCVLKENESEIKAIQDFAASLGAIHRLDDILSYRLNGSNGPFMSRGKLPGVAEPRIGHGGRRIGVDPLSDCRAVSTNPGNLFPCGAGLSQAAITPLGELKLCVMTDYPKYQISGANGLKASWQKLKDLAAGIKPNANYQCGKCELKPYCKWCPARGWLYKRDFSSCEPQSRKRAEAERRLAENKE